MNDKRPLCIVGEGISEKCRRGLREWGFQVFCMPPYDRLGIGVKTHADLMLIPLEDRFFIYGELAAQHPELIAEIEARGVTVVALEGHPAERYPEDIALNCLVVGNYIFCRKDFVSRQVLEYAECCGYSVVNTRQGYARCTACPVSERGIITADPSIRSAASMVGIDVLEVSVGGVLLQGYDYGFIGGACGVFKDKIYFAGDVLAHPDGERIVDFCRELGVEAMSLSDEPLADAGSLFFVE